MLVKNTLFTSKLAEQKAREDRTTKEFKQFKKDEARRWIKSLISKKLKIKSMLEEVKELQTQIGLSGVQYSDMPKNPNANDDAVLNYVLLLEKQTENLKNLITQYEADITRAETILQSLSCHPYAYTILKRHYFKGQSLVYISLNVNYSITQVKEIMSQALLELYDLLPYTEKTFIQHAL